MVNNKKFNNSKDDKVEDAEIVEEKKSSDTALNPVDDLKNIENLINSNIEKIDKLREEMKPVKEMLESLLDADLEYADLSQNAMAANKEKAAKKKQLIMTTNGREIGEKLKSLKSQLKEARNALSSYLQEYQRRTGFNEYEAPDGEIREMVFTVKLVKRKKFDWD